MKAIIKTFSTQDCEKIFNGENDSYCIHKPAPKIEPPFKVYVYQTKEGKVVGEFVYDEEMNVTKVKLYDKPKELGEFGIARAPMSWCYVEEVVE